MSSKIKNGMIVILTSVLLLGISIFGILLKDKTFSYSERRLLKQFPNKETSSLLSGKFMNEFEEYALDQFPLRESFRKLKAYTSSYVLHQRDQSGIYNIDGSLSKMEYPMNIDSIDKATSTFQKIYNRYLKESDTNVYFSVIFDKNYYMADKGSVLSMNYDALIKQLREKTAYMTYIDIQDKLDLDDFYKSDPHWRQESIINVAEKLASAMGSDISTNYEVVTLDEPFYGAYSGQSPLFHESDQLRYLEHKQFQECIVTDYQNNRIIPVYDLEKAKGRDPYEMFLSGSLSLITIENPNATTDKELILFRDSFSSSLAPLLVKGYSKITMVDIRYMQSDMLSSWVDFNNKDVLFLYSTLVLNHGETLK